MVEMMQIDRRPGIAVPPLNGRAAEAAENGNVLYLPHTAFELTNREHRFLDPAIVKQPRRHSGRARIIYLPASQRLLKTTLADAARYELQAMMARFSSWAQDLVADLLRSRPDAGARDLPPLSAQRAAAPACRLVLLLPDRGPARIARAHQHRSGRAAAGLAVRRGAVRAVRGPSAAARTPASAGQRVAAGEARHHQGLPYAL